MLDALAILAIVLLNGVLGFIQEFRAERALAASRTFKVASLPIEDWVLMGALGLLPFLIMEASKSW